MVFVLKGNHVHSQTIVMIAIAWLGSFASLASKESFVQLFLLSTISEAKLNLNKEAFISKLTNDGPSTEAKGWMDGVELVDVLLG